MGQMNDKWLEENYGGGSSHPIRVVPNGTPHPVQGGNTRP